jgi:aminoglycoside/choline kinase family phosphotransferase
LDIGTRLAAAGLHVPAVYAIDVEQGFLLLEDLGVRTYLPELDSDSADALYASALDALFTMQSGVRGDDLKRYDEAFLVMELEYMPEWLLRRHLGRSVSCTELDVLELAFRRIITTVTAQPHCFMHRDFHSRNLMITAQRPPGIIDFQGALYGPITYDLVSLLRDCYIEWPASRVSAWVEDYRQRLSAASLIQADAAQFRRWFDFTGLQRHIKVLGLFCRLCYRDGKPQYLYDLPLVLRYTLDVAEAYPELAEFSALLRRFTRDADLRNPRGELGA